MAKCGPSGYLKLFFEPSICSTINVIVDVDDNNDDGKDDDCNNDDIIVIRHVKTYINFLFEN